MNQNTNQYMAEESIGKLMLRFSIPCIMSLLVSALYNIVDQIFIDGALVFGKRRHQRGIPCDCHRPVPVSFGGRRMRRLSEYLPGTQGRGTCTQERGQCSGLYHCFRNRSHPCCTPFQRQYLVGVRRNREQHRICQGIFLISHSGNSLFSCLPMP